MIRFFKNPYLLGMQIEVFMGKVKRCLGFTLQYKKKVRVYVCAPACVCAWWGHETVLSVS